jgi:hypothetical protein
VDQLVKDVLDLDNQRQAVFRTALEQQMLPVLMTDENYQYVFQDE